MGAALAGLVVLMPLPGLDFLMVLPIQFAIAVAVLAASRRSMGWTRLVPFVLLFALIGSAFGLALEIFIPLFGKLMLAPLALVWCYLLGEMVMLAGTEKD